MSPHFGANQYQITAAPGMAVRRQDKLEKVISPREQEHFRTAVALLLFLIKFSGSGISNAVRQLAKVNNGAIDENYRQILYTVKYVVATHDRVLRYKPKKIRDSICGIFADTTTVNFMETKRHKSASMAFMCLC